MKMRSESPTQTQQLAAEMAAHIVSQGPGTAATIVALEGELGAGKTTFVQGFTQALGVTDVVRSPTFLLMKSYKLKAESYKLLWHIDCYRINDSKELQMLEIENIFSDPQNIVLIEWPERIADILPGQRIIVHLDHLDEHTRQITVTP